MDQADEELRETITNIWPLQAKKMLDLLVPRKDVLNAGKLTVGKIYAGLLILESWRSTRFGKNEPKVPVSRQVIVRICAPSSFLYFLPRGYLLKLQSLITLGVVQLKSINVCG